MISFCIVSYNTCEILRDCLLSLRENAPGQPYEIIVVDNHSEDGTSEMITRDFPWVKLILNIKNLGYTAPMNQALKEASGEYLVQLNPDTLVLPGTFDTLVTFLGSHPKVGIVTPKVLNRDGTLQKQCRRSEARPWDTIAYFLALRRLNPSSKFFNGYLKGYFEENEIHPVEAVSGSCMVIRREVIEQIGFLDEMFYAYQEDSDFCFRARRAEWEIYYVPTAQIIHFGGQGGSQVQLSKSIITWHKSYFLYYRKNLARDYPFFFNWLFYGVMGVKLIFALLSARLTLRRFVGSPKP